MRNLFIILGSLIIILLEALLLYKLEIKGIRPDFLFILVFFIAFHQPLNKSVFPIWLMGLFKDILSQSGLGSTAFIYLISAIIISLVREIIFKEDTLIQIIFLFCTVWFCHFCNGFGLFLYYGTPPLGYIMLKSVFISFYTIIIGGIFLVSFYKIQWYILQYQDKVASSPR